MRSILPLLLILPGLLSANPARSAEPKTLYTYDLTYALKPAPSDTGWPAKTWDQMHFVSSVQGIVNRKAPRLYVFLVGDGTADGATDRHWLDHLRRPGEWWADYRLQALPDLDGLVKQFRSDIKGLVVYDGEVASTSNVASTAAGVEDLACVRYDRSPDSLYHRLAIDPKGPRLPVRLRLVNRDGTSMFTGKGLIPGSKTPSTGSAKCDAYIWAKERYLDMGRCNPAKMGYYLDAYWIKHPGGYVPNNTLSNHDYFIANKGFLFDLSPWDDEAPVDDPNQPIGTDTATLKAILLSAYTRLKGESMIHVGGFLPWGWKYTNYGSAGSKHDGVLGEWRYAEILSCFNAYMDADALGYSALANASAFQHYRLKNRYPLKSPTVADLKAKGYITADGKVAPKRYVTLYAGDYDSAAWLYQRLPSTWDDPARGQVPIAWGFNPNLAERFPVGMAYTRATATPNDFFVTGDSGAGYLNPHLLMEPRKHSGLPSGLDAWSKHCEKWYKQWGLSITGFIIEGDATKTPDAVKEAYKRFSPAGLIVQEPGAMGVHDGLPYTGMCWYLPSLADSIRLMPIAMEGPRPMFRAVRTVLWSASDHKKLVDGVRADPRGKDIEFVDPYTLMLLIKQQYGQK